MARPVGVGGHLRVTSKREVVEREGPESQVEVHMDGIMREHCRYIRLSVESGVKTPQR